MIRLPKKIVETIQKELTQDYSVLGRVFVDSQYKALTIHFVVLRVGYEHRLVLLRYWGDGSYSFLSGFNDMNEVNEELALLVRDSFAI